MTSTHRATTRALLACGVVAGPFYIAVALIQMAIRPVTGILFLAAFIGIASGSKGPVSLYFALAVVLGFVWISTVLTRVRREVTG
jgi:hypothetical protein